MRARRVERHAVRCGCEPRRTHSGLGELEVQRQERIFHLARSGRGRWGRARTKRVENAVRADLGLGMVSMGWLGFVTVLPQAHTAIRWRSKPSSRMVPSWRAAAMFATCGEGAAATRRGGEGRGRKGTRRNTFEDSHTTHRTQDTAAAVAAARLEAGHVACRVSKGREISPAVYCRIRSPGSEKGRGLVGG